MIDSSLVDFLRAIHDVGTWLSGFYHIMYVLDFAIGPPSFSHNPAVFMIKGLTVKAVQLATFARPCSVCLALGL